MSTYYEYREVKTMIAHKLMTMDGWTVYGYSPDQSDMMSDYYHPASWEGIAVKNGYVLCVDVYGPNKEREIKEYNFDKNTLNLNCEFSEKIKKLEALTVKRGASESEEKSAKEKIIILQEKSKAILDEGKKYIVTGVIPANQAHPPKCNWHVEKDGIIIAKGNGILKFSEIKRSYDLGKHEGKRMTKDEFREDISRRNPSLAEESLESSVNYRFEEQERNLKLIKEFNNFINKIDTSCGGLLGEGYVYETANKTKYRKENKVIETTSGEIKEGQCFILKTGFNYNCYRGLVYRIHERKTEHGSSFYSCKLNGKLTKECTGHANSNNSFGVNGKLSKWIEDGAISYCDIITEDVAYEVEVTVKKKVS